MCNVVSTCVVLRQADVSTTAGIHVNVSGVVTGAVDVSTNGGNGVTLDVSTAAGNGVVTGTVYVFTTIGNEAVTNAVDVSTAKGAVDIFKTVNIDAVRVKVSMTVGTVSITATVLSNFVHETMDVSVFVGLKVII